MIKLWMQFRFKKTYKLPNIFLANIAHSIGDYTCNKREIIITEVDLLK